MEIVKETLTKVMTTDGKEMMKVREESVFDKFKNIFRKGDR